MEAVDREAEARILGAITDIDRASWRHIQGPAGREKRARDRLLYAKLQELHALPVRRQQLAKALGVSDERIRRLLRRPPPSEEEVAARAAAVAAERQAGIEMLQAREQARREAREQRALEEAQETTAWAKHCLIEAYEEMRDQLPVNGSST